MDLHAGNVLPVRRPAQLTQLFRVHGRSGAVAQDAAGRPERLSGRLGQVVKPPHRSTIRLPHDEPVISAPDEMENSRVTPGQGTNRIPRHAPDSEQVVGGGGQPFSIGRNHAERIAVTDGTKLVHRSDESWGTVGMCRYAAAERKAQRNESLQVVSSDGVVHGHGSSYGRREMTATWRRSRITFTWEVINEPCECFGRSD